jgi:hypothetical protein
MVRGQSRCDENEIRAHEGFSDEQYNPGNFKVGLRSSKASTQN